MISYRVIRHEMKPDRSVLEEYETRKKEILFHRCLEWSGCQVSIIYNVAI